jgi:hypothetical protein
MTKVPGRSAPETTPPGDEAADYIFVVGLSRSGTTLMRHMLHSHPEIAICPENHFMGHLVASEGVRHKLRRFQPFSVDANARRAIAFLYDGGLRGASRFRAPSRLWTWLVKSVPQQEMVDRFLASERTEASLFAAVMDLYAEKKGKRIAGEKTPAHLRYVPDLLSWYPEGRVVHLMRDPRAIFSSEVRRRRVEPGGFPYVALRRLGPLLTVFVLAETTLTWAEGARRWRRYRREHADRYRMVRFEDLVRHPEDQLRSICAFVGVPFDPAILEQRVVSHGSRLGDSGIDAGAADRWRGSLPGWADRWFRIALGADLRALGYLEPAA